ncbi:hypothetical protein D3C87_1579480 [compost metagenome]
MLVNSLILTNLESMTSPSSYFNSEILISPLNTHKSLKSLNILDLIVFKNIASFGLNSRPISSFISLIMPCKLVSPANTDPPLHSHIKGNFFVFALLLIKISFFKFKIIAVTTR